MNGEGEERERRDEERGVQHASDRDALPAKTVQQSNNGMRCSPAGVSVYLR